MGITIHKKTKIKLIILLKNFLFFILLLFVPFFILMIFRVFTYKGFFFESETTLFATINYFSFLIFFVILYIFFKKEVNWFCRENWFYTLGTVLVPSIRAFGFGFDNLLLLYIVNFYLYTIL